MVQIFSPESVELLDLKSNLSLVRTFLDRPINLLDVHSPSVSLPQNFRDLSFYPLSRDHLYYASKGVAEELASKGFEKKLSGGVHEALKNAYEHGNKRDSTKRVTLLSSVDSDLADFIIGDEGGNIDGNLFSYILAFRESNQKGNHYLDLPSFYDFISGTAPEGHSGVGTRVMHLLFDQVRYFKGPTSGLLVHLHKSQ